MNNLNTITLLAGILIVSLATALFIMFTPAHCYLTNLMYEDIATCK